MLLRPGNAGSNTAADHLVVLEPAACPISGHNHGLRRTCVETTMPLTCGYAFLWTPEDPLGPVFQ